MSNKGYPIEWFNHKEFDEKKVFGILDHTFLKTQEYYKAIGEENPIKKERLYFQNFMYGMVPSKVIPYAVCVRPERVRDAKKILDKIEHPEIKVASVVGFPQGNLYSTARKLEEVNDAMRNGADEIDMVLRYNDLKEGKYDAVSRDIREVYHKTHFHGGLLKVILETSELNFEQIAKASQICEKIGVDFIKTSTGYSQRGANFYDLEIMRENFSRGIKISGGVNIDNWKDLLEGIVGNKTKVFSFDPMKIRIGESSLSKQLFKKYFK